MVSAHAGRRVSAEGVAPQSGFLASFICDLQIQLGTSQMSQTTLYKLTDEEIELVEEAVAADWLFVNAP